jgi:hypothetical protein
VLEASSEGAAEHAAAAVPLPASAVPASLHASLMARLDRLGAAKEVAQIGAVIGREFSHALLAAVVRQPEAELGSAVDRLIARCARPSAKAPVCSTEPIIRCPIMSGTVAVCFSASARNWLASSRMLFSVLFSFWTTSFVAFKGDAPLC